jgi:hypothetical protein
MPPTPVLSERGGYAISVCKYSHVDAGRDKSGYCMQCKRLTSISARRLRHRVMPRTCGHGAAVNIARCRECQRWFANPRKRAQREADAVGAPRERRVAGRPAPRKRTIEDISPEHAPFEARVARAREAGAIEAVRLILDRASAALQAQERLLTRRMSADEAMQALERIAWVTPPRQLQQRHGATESQSGGRLPLSAKPDQVSERTPSGCGRIDEGESDRTLRAL